MNLFQNNNTDKTNSNRDYMLFSYTKNLTENHVSFKKNVGNIHYVQNHHQTNQ